jgi:hypothetical protein
MSQAPDKILMQFILNPSEFICIDTKYCPILGPLCIYSVIKTFSIEEQAQIWWKTRWQLVLTAHATHLHLSFTSSVIL